MIRKEIRVSTGAPSMTVIQAAYNLCSGPEMETNYYRGLGRGNPQSFASSRVEITFVTRPPFADWLKFQGLVAQWHRERGATSSITEAALCPAYQCIIGMGSTAIPFIVAQLKSEGDEPDQWFWALKAISHADPVGDEDRGDYVAMARKWLQWAQNEGYA